MSFWIHAFCHQSVATVTPDDLKAGIAKRLKLLTYLFCPEDEEDPDQVLSRLRIENRSADNSFGEFLLYYRQDSAAFIHVGRYGPEAVDELEESLQSRRDAKGIGQIRQMLAGVKEDVSFDLKASDARGMGFPLAIAGAAYLVEQAGGLIQSGTYTWMVPDGAEVRILLELKG